MLRRWEVLYHQMALTGMRDATEERLWGAIRGRQRHQQQLLAKGLPAAGYFTHTHYKKEARGRKCPDRTWWTVSFEVFVHTHGSPRPTRSKSPMYCTAGKSTPSHDIPDTYPL